MIKDKLKKTNSKDKTFVLMCYMIEKYEGLYRHRPKPICFGDLRYAEVQVIAEQLDVSAGYVAAALKMYTSTDQYCKAIIESGATALRVSILTGMETKQEISELSVDQAKEALAKNAIKRTAKSKRFPPKQPKTDKPKKPTKKRRIIGGNTSVPIKQNRRNFEAPPAYREPEEPQKKQPSVTVKRKRTLSLKRD